MDTINHSPSDIPRPNLTASTASTSSAHRHQSNNPPTLKRKKTTTSSNSQRILHLSPPRSHYAPSPSTSSTNTNTARHNITSPHTDINPNTLTNQSIHTTDQYPANNQPTQQSVRKRQRYSPKNTNTHSPQSLPTRTTTTSTSTPDIHSTNTTTSTNAPTALSPTSINYVSNTSTLNTQQLLPTTSNCIQHPTVTPLKTTKRIRLIHREPTKTIKKIKLTMPKVNQESDELTSNDLHTNPKISSHHTTATIEDTALR